MNKMRIRFDTNTGDFLYKNHLLINKIELTQIKRKIETFATFLPNEILDTNFLLDSSSDQLFVGVLLYINITGVTQLIEKFQNFIDGDIYKLTATLNAYIGTIVEIIYYYGGDVLKISGEGCLTMWKVSPDESLNEILHLAATCALVIKRELEDFNTSLNVPLRMKQSISCGNMSMALIGDDFKAFVVIGECVEELRKVDTDGQVGNVYISNGAWDHMLQERFEVDRTAQGHVRIIPGKIFYKPNEADKKLFYESKQEEAKTLVNIHLDHIKTLNTMRRVGLDLTENKALFEILKDIQPRPSVKLAPKFWHIDNLRCFITKNIQDHVEENQMVEYLTEVRMVTVQIIRVTASSNNEMVFRKLWDNVYKRIWIIIEPMKGIITKITNYHDLTIMVVYGLHSVNHEMESQNSLRSSFKIQNQLHQVTGVEKVSVSVGRGLVYCGVVGHPMRREFVVLGNVVQRTLKISQRFLGKVTCDYRSFKTSKLASFYFRSLNARSLKIRDFNHLIFEYNEQAQNDYDTMQSDFEVVGRNSEIAYLQEKLVNQRQFAIFIRGEPKVGKSALLESLCRYAIRSNNFTVASLCLEEFSNIPYFATSKIYSQLYDLNAQTHVGFNDLDLTRELWDPHQPEVNEDIAYKKYRILNNFRTMIKFACQRPSAIFIDNIEFIDSLSWEVLEIILLTCKYVRIFMTGDYDKLAWDFKYQLVINSRVEIYDIYEIPDKYLPFLIGRFTQCAAIDKKLTSLLMKTWHGCPGYVQTCLLRYFNNEGVQLVTHERGEDEDLIYVNDFTYPLVTALILSPSYQFNVTDDLTLTAISMDFLGSFTPFQQLIIKTASVLGMVFTRTLLLVALHYPDEETLTKSIRKLFEKQIFDCGSRYVNGLPINLNKLCCCCYFEDEITSDYGKCKILHFNDKSIKSVAYDLLPENQRKELHILCTEVIENIDHVCPRCLRDPFHRFVISTKYKDMLYFCNNPNELFTMPTCATEDYSFIKDTIKSFIGNENEPSAKPIENYEMPRFNPKECNCFEILLQVFGELINHSKQAQLLEKIIYFTYKYGMLLICMKDIVRAIATLREAREFCMVDYKKDDAQITHSFRRFLIGKTSCSLASACLLLRQVNQSKNHIAIALRQYNIPSMSLSYKHFRLLLRKRYLINRRTVHPVQWRNTRIQWDMGVTLAICAKIFAMEGNYNFAKYCSAYSICLLKSINPKLPILFDAYCTAIDIYRHGGDLHMCEKLHRYVAKEVIFNYCNNTFSNVSAILDLMNVMFEVMAIRGDINEAIRFGYRIIDFTTKIYMYVNRYDVFLWMAQLLIYSLRFTEYMCLVNVLRELLIADTEIWYLIALLDLYMTSGFIIMPVQKLLSTIDEYLKTRPVERLNYEERYLKSLAFVHFLRLGQVQNHYKDHFIFNSNNLRRPIIMKLLLVTIEATTLTMIRRKRAQNDYMQDLQYLKKLFLLGHKFIGRFPVLKPWFCCLKAWKYKIMNRKRSSRRMLRKCLRISEKQCNRFFVCQVMQLKNAWGGGYAPSYHKRPMARARESYSYSELQLSQYLHAYTLD